MKETIILSRLLDKYERSKHLLEPGASARRVMLRVEKKELPEYRYQEAEIRDAFNHAASELERDDLISVEWFKDRPVLSTVVLNLDRVMECYQLTGRIHPKELAAAVKDMVSARLSRVTVDWVAAWRDEVCREAEEQCRVPQLCKKNLSALSDLLTALAEYDALNGNAVTMRAFSSKCYHDTKYFEREIREAFLKAALQTNAGLAEACELEALGDRERLIYLGIYPRPELYELSGRCVIHTHRGSVDAAAMVPYGLALPSTAVDGILSLDLREIRKIVFIENKTNYDAYLVSEQRSDELVLYHGGFLSPQKRKLFAKVQESITTDAEVFFWADIDLGGFQMFRNLQQIIPSLRPMRMSEKEVEEYRRNGYKRSEDYLEKVRKALEENRFPMFCGALRCILEYGVTIEQETML